MTHLLLLGGGHAHLEVLRALARRPLAGAAVTLVTPAPLHHYSGMVPGFLRGRWAEADIAVDLVPLARAAGARLVLARAESIDAATRTCRTSAGPICYDLLSIDVGAAPAGLDGVPGAAEHAVALRPIGRVREAAARLREMVRGERPAAAVVVGAGAAGVELTLAVAGALADAGRAGTVALVDRADGVLPGLPGGVRRRAARALARAGVRVVTGAALAAVERERVLLDPARSAAGTPDALPSALTLWVAGAAAPAVVATVALPRDARGFLRVDATLRSVDGAPVWGAGDCVALDGAAWVAKAGVYAVRQGPVLAHNLRAAVAGGAMRRYRPQRDFLALLSTEGDAAILRWRGVSAEGRWVERLKARIDRGFVRRYQRVGAPAGGPGDAGR